MKQRCIIVAGIALGVLMNSGALAQQGKYKNCGEGGSDVNAKYWMETNGIQLENANCVTPPTAKKKHQAATLMSGAAYAWRQFLYLASKENGDYRMMRFGDVEDLMPAEGKPPSWQKASGKGLSGGQTGKNGGINSVQQAASMVPVVDKNGRWLHYSEAVNRDEWRYVAGRSPLNEDPLYTSAGYNKKICGAILKEQGKEVPDKIPNPTPPWLIPYADCLQGWRCVSSKGSGCVRVDPKNFTLTLPETSIELKASWRVLETCDLPDSPKPKAKCMEENFEDGEGFVMVKTTVDPYGPGELYREEKVTLALVGLHILSKTNEQKDWVWSTFEHRGNARDCRIDPATKRPPIPFNMFCLPEPLNLARWEGQAIDPFTVGVGELDHKTGLVQQARYNGKTPTPSDANGVSVIKNNRLQCVSDPNSYINGWPRLYNPEAHKPVHLTMDPTRICRLTPVDETIATFNAEMHAKVAEVDPESPLANYGLVGVFWFDADCRTSDCNMVGTTTNLANTMAETYLQDLTCTVCHGANQSNPNPYNKDYIAAGFSDRSFIFQRIRQ